MYTEEQIKEMEARLSSLQNENDGLKSKNEALESDKASAEEQAIALQTAKAASDAALKEAQAQLKSEVEKTSPLSFTIDGMSEEDLETLGVENGDVFEFTAPTCTWDDNSIVNFRELAASDEKKDRELYALICAKLVQRNSGLIRRKEK